MSKGAQVALAAVVGGTAEALGGGKPARLCRNNALANARIIRRGGVANGAVTGAYVMMLNHLGHQENSSNDNNRSYVIEFNGEHLKIIDESTKELILLIEATSGKGDFMNMPLAQNIENLGPIQEGLYLIYSNEWDHLSKLRQVYNIIRGNGDWGDYNVPLHPLGYRTRSNFYLHGGFFEGSAGCIDAVRRISEVYHLLKNQDITLLRVRYY